MLGQNYFVSKTYIQRLIFFNRLLNNGFLLMIFKYLLPLKTVVKKQGKYFSRQIQIHVY